MTVSNDEHLPKDKERSGYESLEVFDYKYLPKHKKGSGPDTCSHMFRSGHKPIPLPQKVEGRLTKLDSLRDASDDTDHKRLKMINSLRYLAEILPPKYRLKDELSLELYHRANQTVVESVIEIMRLTPLDGLGYVINMMMLHPMKEYWWNCEKQYLNQLPLKFALPASGQLIKWDFYRRLSNNCSPTFFTSEDWWKNSVNEKCNEQPDATVLYHLNRTNPDAMQKLLKHSAVRANMLQFKKSAIQAILKKNPLPLISAFKAALISKEESDQQFARYVFPIMLRTVNSAQTSDIMKYCEKKLKKNADNFCRSAFKGQDAQAAIKDFYSRYLYDLSRDSALMILKLFFNPKINSNEESRYQAAYYLADIYCDNREDDNGPKQAAPYLDFLGGAGDKLTREQHEAVLLYQYQRFGRTDKFYEAAKAHLPYVDQFHRDMYVRSKVNVVKSQRVSQPAYLTSSKPVLTAPIRQATVNRSSAREQRVPSMQARNPVVDHNLAPRQEQLRHTLGQIKIHLQDEYLKHRDTESWLYTKSWLCMFTIKNATLSNKKNTVVRELIGEIDAAEKQIDRCQSEAELVDVANQLSERVGDAHTENAKLWGTHHRFCDGEGELKGYLEGYQASLKSFTVHDQSEEQDLGAFAP